MKNSHDRSRTNWHKINKNVAISVMISPHYEGHSHVMVEDRDRQTLQCQQCNGFSFAARCTTVSGNALTRYTAHS